MFKKKFNQPKTLALILILVVLAAIVYGYAASNSVPESGAGEGSGTISGYLISSIHYSLLNSDPTKVNMLSMQIAPDGNAGVPSQVRISVDDGTTWITCSSPATPNWECLFSAGSEPAVLNMHTLQVVAVQ